VKERSAAAAQRLPSAGAADLVPPPAPCADADGRLGPSLVPPSAVIPRSN